MTVWPSPRWDCTLALKIEMNLSAEKVDLLNEICAPLAEELGVPNLRLFASSEDLRAELKEFTKEWPAQDVSVKTKLTPAQPLKTVPKVGDKLELLDDTDSPREEVRHGVAPTRLP